MILAVICPDFFFISNLMFSLNDVLCIIVGVCKIFEEHLKRMNPSTPSITYDISQLFDFVDQLADISCLV